jgi:hypothetical protein
MRCRFACPRSIALSIAITLCAASSAVAQDAAPTFAKRLSGKDVWITADGTRVRGRVTSLWQNGLVLVEDGASMTIPYGRIVRVEKSSHRLRNGTLIGLAAGAGLGLLAIAGCSWNCPEDVIILPALHAGLGAAAGVGIGALINEAKKNGDVLYDARRSTTTLALAPVFSLGHRGLAFTMTWR